jgi:hypothetical protein
MGQADIHRDCADDRPPAHGAARARDVRKIATCCATSEWLLWYTQSARAVPGLSAIPVRKSLALEPDRGVRAPIEARAPTSRPGLRWHLV